VLRTGPASIFMVCFIVVSSLFILWILRFLR